MYAIDLIIAKGHRNVKAYHKTTLEITKDNYLTPRGDCIIGIMSSKGAKDLNDNVKQLIQKDESYVYCVIQINDKIDIIHGRGSSKLSLTNPQKIIIRKSDFISDSTIMIKADKASKDIRRDLIDELRKGTEAKLYIIASDSPLKDEELLRIIVNFNPLSITNPL
jgi:hypothetical protein